MKCLVNRRFETNIASDDIPQKRCPLRVNCQICLSLICFLLIDIFLTFYDLLTAKYSLTDNEPLITKDLLTVNCVNG